MSEEQTQGEPSMEEILASIRRIISDDEADEQQNPAENSMDAQAVPQEENEEDDILELTDKVEPEMEAREEAEPEPEVEAEPEMEAQSAEESEELDGGDAFDALADAMETEVADDTSDEEGVELAFDDGDSESDDGDEDDFTFEESVSETEMPLVAAETDAVFEADEPAETKGPSMLADVTQEVTASALSEIAKAAVAQRSLAIGSGKTIEDLVREALVPELKAWLDVRLAPMVEKIVREEIRKMVRRAEDL